MSWGDKVLTFYIEGEPVSLPATASVEEITKGIREAELRASRRAQRVEIKTQDPDAGAVKHSLVESATGTVETGTATRIGSASAPCTVYSRDNIINTTTPTGSVRSVQTGRQRHSHRSRSARKPRSASRGSSSSGIPSGMISPLSRSYRSYKRKRSSVEKPPNSDLINMGQPPPASSFRSRRRTRKRPVRRHSLSPDTMSEAFARSLPTLDTQLDDVPEPSQGPPISKTSELSNKPGETTRPIARTPHSVARSPRAAVKRAERTASVLGKATEVLSKPWHPEERGDEKFRRVCEMSDIEMWRALCDATSMFKSNTATYDTTGLSILNSQCHSAGIENWIHRTKTEISKTKSMCRAVEAMCEDENAILDVFVGPPNFTVDEGRLYTTLGGSCWVTSPSRPEKRYEGKFKVTDCERLRAMDMRLGKYQLASALGKQLSTQLKDCNYSEALCSATVDRIRDNFMSIVESEDHMLSWSRWDRSIPSAAARHYEADVSVRILASEHNASVEEGQGRLKVVADVTYSRHSMRWTGDTCLWSKEPEFKFQLQESIRNVAKTSATTC